MIRRCQQRLKFVGLFKSDICSGLNKARYVCFLLLLNYTCLQAQVQTKLNPDVILIGDTASLQITVTFDKSQEVILPQIGDSLNRYVEVTNQKVDTLIVGNNANYVQNLTLTSFEAGEFLVNSLPIIIDKDTLQSESYVLTIQDLEVETEMDSMYPIKSILPQEITWWERNKQYVAYIAIGLILLIIAIILVWLYIRASKKDKYVSKPLLPPYEEALENLKKLDKQKYLEQNKYYEYYSDLSSILRRYFTRRFDFPALALLSGDLPQVMKDKEYITSQEAEELGEFLSDADLAKYARKVPSAEKHDNYRNWIEDIIRRTRPLLEDDLPEHIKAETESEKLRKIDNS